MILLAVATVSLAGSARAAESEMDGCLRSLVPSDWTRVDEEGVVTFRPPVSDLSAKDLVLTIRSTPRSADTDADAARALAAELAGKGVAATSHPSTFWGTRSVDLVYGDSTGVYRVSIFGRDDETYTVTMGLRHKAANQSVRVLAKLWAYTAMRDCY